MLPEQHRHTLIDASISFMKTVSEIYGAERGQELWQEISRVIDPDLKNEVFMAMLTGNYRLDKLSVKNPWLGPVHDKIALIKCLRSYDRRNLGLKDAKDIADRLENGGVEVLEVRPDIRPTFIVELRKLGIVV